MLLDEFKTPGNDCRGTDFWMLNDELNGDELRRQLRSMHAQGVASIIARTYAGLRSDYPGKDWMEKMHIVVDEARQLGMTVFMQAGYMPEAVLNLPVEYSLGDVRCYKKGEGEGTILDSYEDIDYCLVPSKLVLDMLSPEACAFYVKQSYEDMWQEFREEYGKTIVSVWVDEPSYRKLSLPWTNAIPATYEMLWGERFPFEKVHLLFVDGEGDRLMRLRFWRTVLYLMKNAYFKSVRDWCNQNHLMFSGHLMAEDTMESQIFSTCYTMPMYQYFDIPGIDFLTAAMDWNYGEIKPEHPEDKIWPEYGSFMTPLQCSSVAHQNGQNKVLAEMYGVSTENLGFRDQKHFFDHLAAMGINHRSIHGIFYSLRGRGKRAYPPHISDYQPYWPKYHILTDALARETTFVRAGVPEKDVLLLHPMETAFSLFHGKFIDGEFHNDSLQRKDQAVCQLVRTLCANQVNFELGDEDTISQLGHVTEEGRFVVGQMTYSTVLLVESTFLRESTLSLLSQFIKAGGHLLILGDFPQFTDKGCLIEKEVFADGKQVQSYAELIHALQQVPMTYRFMQEENGTHAEIYLRRDQEDLLFFITNSNCKRKVSGILQLSGSFGCQQLDEKNGEILPYPVLEKDSTTEALITLPEGATILLRFSPKIATQKPVPFSGRMELPIHPEWKLKRENPNALVLEYFRFAKGNLPLSDPLPILAIQDLLIHENYNGEITLETSFKLDCPLNSLQLVLEYPEKQQLFVDGKPIENKATGHFLNFAFQTVPLPDLEKGIHTLRIHRTFSPLKKPTSTVTSLFENLGGVELEQVLILGDFAVRSLVEPGVQGTIRVNDDFTLTAENNTVRNELVTAGYPFYAGTMVLETVFELPENAKNPFLSLEGLHAAAAEVFVNDVSCGVLCWDPYQVPLSSIHTGKNTLKIRLFPTLHNLLGPWHRTVGEVGAAWGGYDAPNLPWLGLESTLTGKRYPDWYTDRKPDRDGWTDSYLCLPLGIVHPKLSWEMN